jgi:hypothetical protein
MMNAKSIVKKLLHLFIARLPYTSPKEGPLRMVFTTKLVKRPFSQCSFLESHGRLDSLFSCMHKDHYLMPLAYKLGHLFKRDAVKVFARLEAAGLASDANEVLLKGDGSE